MQSTIVKITSTIVVLLLLFNFLVIHVETVKSINQNPNLKKSNDVTLPPCAACKLLIESFKKVRTQFQPQIHIKIKQL